MIDEEKKFIKEVNVDKAENNTKAAIIVIFISILTYIIPLIYGVFDFGIVFEIVSLVFLLISKHYMTYYDEKKSKGFIICAMVPMGWLLIYDMIIFLFSITKIEDIAFLVYDFYWIECLPLLYLLILSTINRNLAKANNPAKYKESTDWFYEKYEKKDK